MILALELCLLVLAGMLVVMQHLFRYPAQNLKDVKAAARPSPDEEWETLLDAWREAELRNSLSLDEYRRELRVRMHLALEHLRRRGFDAHITMDWAYAERKKAAQTLTEQITLEQRWKLYLIGEVQDAGIQFRVYWIAALAKLTMWIVLRGDLWPLAMPSLSSLREASGINGSQAWERLTKAAANLAWETHGENESENLLLALRGSVPLF